MYQPSLGDLLYASIFILCTYFCWCYWKLIQSVNGIPFHSVGIKSLLRASTGRYPPGVSYTAYWFDIFLTASKKFQDEGLFVLWFFQPLIFVYGEEISKKFLNEPSAVDRNFFYDIVSQGTGQGIITAKISTWEKQRKLVNPAFRMNVLRGKINIFNRIARDIVRQLSEFTDQQSVDVSDILRSNTFKAIYESAFGVPSNCKDHDKKFSEAAELLERLQAYSIYIIFRPWLYPEYSSLLFQERRKCTRASEELKSIIKTLIAENTSANIPHTPEENELKEEQCSNKTLARTLFENHVKDPSFTMQNIQDEVQTILLAGHDTTNFTMAWCLFMLGLHPDVQERAYEEVQSVKGSSNDDIGYSDLNQLIYLESVIKETLRIYPVVPIFLRKTTKEITCGKYRIPKNASLVFSPYLLHRNPNVYPDPEMFDPGRFYDKNLKHPWLYGTFAEGIRNCIGKNFAMMEIKIFLAHILRNFKIETLDRREDVKICWTITLHPEKPIRFKFTSRDISD